MTQSRMKFVQVEYESIKGFRKLAKKDRVSLSETKNTLWFHIKRDEELMGFCGIFLAKNKARLKGAWLLPQYRGMGNFDFINDCRLKVVKDYGYEKVEVFTLHRNHYTKRGFNLVRETKNKGIYLMELNIV